ncbi:MAG: NfeD family protein [Chloroflexota bacterium]
MDFVTSFLPQIFIVTGLLLILLELVVGIETGLDMVLIGSVLLISGFVGLLVGNTTLMLILAIGLSVLYIAVGRRQIRHRMTVTTNRTNVDRLIGAPATVVRQIAPDKAGMVRMDDEEWRAIADEILYEKDIVTVESIEGVTLRVRKLAK